MPPLYLLLRRLGYYLGGFAIGLLLLFLFLKEKNTRCTYLPSARVTSNLLAKNYLFSDEIKKNHPQLTGEKLITYINNATVDFSKSELRKDTCNIYHLFSRKDKVYFSVENCPEQFVLLSLNFN